MRILVVDGHHSSRSATRQMLETRTDHDVVGEASDGLEAIALVGALHPDLVVMDIQMPLLGGIEATKIIKQRFPHIRVVGFSLRQDPHIAGALGSAGGETLIRKDRSEELLTRLTPTAA